MIIQIVPGVRVMALSLLAASLDGGLGDLAGGGVLLGDGLDDADGNRLPHVTDGEPAERRVGGEWFHGHGLGRSHLDDGGITVLDGLGEGLQLFAGTTIASLEDFLKFASNVGGVAIHDGCVTVLDRSGVVEDDDLRVEVLALLGWVVLGVRGDVATTDFLDGDVLDVEADVVAGESLGKRLVVHLHGLDLSGDVSGSKCHDHTRLDDASFNTTDWHCSNSSDLVDILEGKTKGLVGGARRRDDGVEGIDEGHAGCRSLFFGLLGPSLFLLAVSVSTDPPGHLLGLFQHVVSMPPRDGAENNFLGIVTDLLDVSLDFFTNFQESRLVVRVGSGGVHLVDTDDELLDTQRVGEQGMFAGLAILGNASLELTCARSNDEDGTIGLRSARNHVFDEISVAGSVDDGDVVVLGLELPESDVDGDTTFALGLQLVEDPGILEGALAHLLGFLLEFFDDTFVNTTAFVDEMAGRSRLARVDVTDDDDVNVELFFSHFGLIVVNKYKCKGGMNSRRFLHTFKQIETTQL